MGKEALKTVFFVVVVVVVFFSRMNKTLNCESLWNSCYLSSFLSPPGGGEHTAGRIAVWNWSCPHIWV